MPADFSTGTMFSASMPQWQRTYYEALLLETLRTKSILMPFCTVKEDFRARDTGIITYSEVYDTDHNYNPMAEDTLWLKGAHLDSRTQSISLAIYGDMLKFSDYSEIVQYVNQGNLRGLVQDKIGQNQVDFLDILCRNAFLTHPHKVFAGGTKATRELIAATDLFNPDFAELARTHLEEAEVPGVVATQDSDIQTIVCVTTPRVVHDIRTAAGSNWLEVHQYADGAKKFTGEAGTWGGVRFVRTNRLVLRNHGAVTHQAVLNGATVAGQGAAATVDTIYAPGQATSTRYITVDDVTGFAVGQRVTLHSKSAG
jgi:N4-gp56 family major capsid protein